MRHAFALSGEKLERGTIERALDATGYNVARAARELGASRRTLQHRMKEYGLRPGKPGRRKRSLPYLAKKNWHLGLGAAAGILGIVAIGHFTKK